MSGINRVVVSGNLTRDPELRQAGSTTVLQFGIAVNERFKNSQTDQWEDRPNYFDVLIWGRRGEALSRHLTKGQKVALEGRLRWSQWDDKNTGAKRSKVEIVADSIDFMSGPREEGAARQADNDFAAPAQNAPSIESLTEDIPF